MADSDLKKRTEKTIRILLVDDSIVFRRFLQEAIKEMDSVTICGIAKNGIAALDLILKVKPHVILMDLEMPLMDGVTALQHLMIHRPTPTIIFSSQADEGSRHKRAAVKNGAVGFFSKADFFDTSRQQDFLVEIRQAILQAANTPVQPLAVKAQDVPTIPRKQTSQRLVFCEECGARNTVDPVAELTGDSVPLCCACGDQLILTN